MGESQYAKDLRREAQAQTDFAAAAYEQSVESRAYAEQAARYNEDAAVAASNAEYHAAEQLEAQLEHNEAVRAHHFAMWRQETLNGQAYERWREQADSLYAEFNRRWHAWRKAQDEDVAAVRANREAQVNDRFKLNSRLHKVAAFVTRDSDLDWWWTTKLAFALCLASALIGYPISAGMQSANFGHSWALSMLGVFLTITIGRMVAVPLAGAHHKRLMEAQEWVMTEEKAFTASFPQLWGVPGEWHDVYAVHEIITSMPREYVNFKDGLLVEVPARQPSPVGVETLPAEAVRTKSLLDSWRDR